MRVAINGFGRIGRLAFRAAHHIDNLEFVAINDLTDAKTLAHLLTYDSVHGKFPGVVEERGGNLLVNNREIQILAERDPARLPWKKLDIDVVVESTGFFESRESAGKHLDGGAKRVLVSAPAKGVKTIIMGVNQASLTQNDTLVSNGSCTTNCLAPIVKVLHDAYGIEHGFMLTVHSYTSSQRLVDGPESDLRRARAAALNLVPTRTGAATAVVEAIPQLKGRLDGLAVRAPTPCGSLVDFTASVNRDTSVEAVNELFAEAASDGMLGIIQYSDAPLVSTDIIGNAHSAIFDAPMTRVLGKRFVKVLAWYDNEWGFSSRLVDLLRLMAS